MKMPFKFINRHSLNLEQLRRQQWQDSSENITLSQIARPLVNGESVMLSPSIPPQPGTQIREWGEEKDDGVIYHVVLKRVRYHTTNKLPLNDNVVSHLEWETQKRRTIKAGTLAKLIEHLVPDNDHIDEIDTGFLTVFLTMYQTFSTAEEVVAQLIDRFKTVKKKKLSNDFENFVRVTVNVLLVWIENFPADFKKDSSCRLLKQLQTFAKYELKGKHGEEVLRKTQQLLDKCSPTHEMSQCDNAKRDDGDESGESLSFSESHGLIDYAPIEIAEQLTLIDADLFKAVIPRDCVGCVWSRRDKNDNKQKASSVKATVNQFNAVSRRVTTTILFGEARGTPIIMRRAKRLEAWIEIAQECRDLKNFSSLKAIVSALQSAPIHRLKKTWAAISRNHHTSFEELSALVSEDSNQQIVRELLKKEGTAKTVQLKKKSSLTRKLTHQRQPDNGNISGTVPYLGTFLTDLMMLDTAYPDKIDGNLINFEKRQKEFEIIAQIRLFQEAAKNYSILPDNDFRLWFDSLETLTEDEYFTLSCSLESGSLPKRQASLFRSRKLKSENDLVKVSSFKEDDKDSRNEITHRRQNSGSSIRSEGCPRMYGCGHIIRVSMQNEDSCNLYKSIWIAEGDRTPAVIKSCLTKHHIDTEQVEEYVLVQILSNGNEVIIPKDANVYYAMVPVGKDEAHYFVVRKDSS